MLAVLSPAKTLDYRTPLPPVAPSSARLMEQTDALVRGASRLGARKLSGLMHISDTLAKLNAERYRGFHEQPERPALYAFAGDVYAGFEVKSLDEPAIRFAQDHVRILSGLYGLLRPLDAIRPYRLEMGTRWAPGRAKNLYDFWGCRISDLLAADLAEDGSGVIVNLASREYWHAVETAPPKGARIITVDFRENGPDGLRFNGFAAKRARGMLARYICEHRLTDPEMLKSFDSDGYRFAGAEGDTWRFVRA
jgi:uncharacterized protein